MSGPDRSWVKAQVPAKRKAKAAAVEEPAPPAPVPSEASVPKDPMIISDDVLIRSRFAGKKQMKAFF